MDGEVAMDGVAVEASKGTVKVGEVQVEEAATPRIARAIKMVKARKRSRKRSRLLKNLIRPNGTKLLIRWVVTK